MIHSCIFPRVHENNVVLQVQLGCNHSVTTKLVQKYVQTKDIKDRPTYFRDVPNTDRRLSVQTVRHRLKAACRARRPLKSP